MAANLQTDLVSSDAHPQSVATVNQHASSGDFLARHEGKILLGLLLLFLVVNVVTGARCPTVIGDEMMWTDPAANLYFGKGFTSSVWYVQSPSAFWAGNVPLYPLVLYVWLRLFGFGPLAVRSMGYVMMLGAAILLWSCVRRRGWIATPRWRLAMVALVLSGYGTAYSYRMGRPDAMTVLLACGAAFASTFQRAAGRWAALASFGFLFPWTGLQLGLYAIIFCGILLAFEWKAFWREAVCVALGEMIGALGLFRLYSTHGVWRDFLRSAVGIHTPLGAMTFSNKLQDIRMNFGGFLKDPSFLLLLALISSLALVNSRYHTNRSRSFFVFALCSSVSVPIAVFLLGIYPIYYSWMAYIPLVVSLCAVLEADWRMGLSAREKRAALGTLVLAGALGLPVYCGLAAGNWAERDPARVARLAERALSRGDWVMCEYGAYYGARRYAQQVFPDFNLARTTTEQRQRISVLIVRPEDSQDAARGLGGSWRDTGEGAHSKSGSALFGLENSKIFEMYNLEVYRRVGTRPPR
jgi:hypothetical protein